MPTLDPAELARLRELRKAATAQPWRAVHDEIVSDLPTRAVAKYREESGKPNAWSGWTTVAKIHQSINGSGENAGPRLLIDDEERDNNRQLIVAAVNNLDALLDMAEAYLQTRPRWTKEVPTDLGYYYARFLPRHRQRIVRVIQRGSDGRVCAYDEPVEDLTEEGWEWSRAQPPTEAYLTRDTLGEP